MKRYVPAVLAALVAGAVPAPAGAAAGVERCAVRGSTPVAANRSVRVYRVDEPRFSRAHYACDRATGRRWRLEHTPSWGDQELVIRVHGLAPRGPYVLLETELTGPSGLILRYLVRADVERRTLRALAAIGDDGLDDGVYVWKRIPRAFVSDRGTVAFSGVRTANDGRRDAAILRVRRGQRKATVLDRGDDVNTFSLTRRGSALRWTRGGVSRNAFAW